MASRLGCIVPECIHPKDKERKSQFCSDHFGQWIASPEWREATRSEDVRFAMSLGLKKEAMKLVNKAGRKFAQRIAKEEEEAATYG